MGTGMKERKEAFTFILYLLLIKIFVLYTFHVWHLKDCQQDFPFLYFPQQQCPKILFTFRGFLYVYKKGANMHLCICTIIIFCYKNGIIYSSALCFSCLYLIHIFPCTDILHKISQQEYAITYLPFLFLGSFLFFFFFASTMTICIIYLCMCVFCRVNPQSGILVKNVADRNTGGQAKPCKSFKASALITSFTFHWTNTSHMANPKWIGWESYTLPTIQSCQGQRRKEDFWIYVQSSLVCQITETDICNFGFVFFFNDINFFSRCYSVPHLYPLNVHLYEPKLLSVSTHNSARGLQPSKGDKEEVLES